MRAGDAARIILVRSIEECRPEAIAPAVRIDALADAGEPEQAEPWLARRAAYLLEHTAGGYRSILAMTNLPHRIATPVLLFGLLVGLASNYLGPSARIHVVFNPMSVLIAWNLAVYAFLGARSARRRPRPPQAASEVQAAERSSPAHSASWPAAPAVPTPQRSWPGPPAERPPWWFRLLVPAFWTRWQRAAAEAGASAAGVTEVARAFWAHWLVIARPLLAASARRTLHGGALGVAVGAVIGMYVRGLFFEYNMVWRSTFVRDFEQVQALLTVVLGPAALLLGQPLPSSADSALLMTSDGTPAARWIHLYAASAALFVILPRLGLAALARLRERRLAGRVEIDLTGTYYRQVLDNARALQVRKLAGMIEQDVRDACARFSQSVAAFVCTELFDARVVPRLVAFRESGGRIADLEAEVRGECEDFETELAGYLPTAQTDLERSLATSVERTVGRALSVETGSSAGLASGVGRASRDAMVGVGSSVGAEVSGAVGLAASAAAAVAAGIVSGGFGKSTGVAIVAVLLHTTGPIGFVVGAVAGFAVAVAGWWLGRSKLTESVKQVALPAAIAQLVLRESALRRIVSEGHERCRAAVAESIEETLAPLTPAIAEQIWARVKPILGAEPPTRPRSRPR